MADPTASLYTVGGTVQAGGGVYIARAVDDELLRLCRAGTFAYILAPRQSGKSSLMVQTARQLEADGVRAATVDLTRLGTQGSAEDWYYAVVEEIHRRLQLPGLLDPWWEAHLHVGPTARLTQFFEEVVLVAIPGRVVIFVDEIDTTLNLAYSDDFFIAIRAMYEARAAVPAFARLSLVLIGVATPGDLIRDPQRTPFNIGTRVDLPDFTPAEAAPLAAGLGLPPDEAGRVLGWALDWTGGHPYLTQRLCQTLAAASPPTATAAAVDAAVTHTFLGAQSERDNNLQFVRDMLTKRAADPQAVLQTYRAIRRGRAVPDEEQSLVKTHLKLSGVVRRVGNTLQVRNRIYGTVFDPTWIAEHLPATPWRTVLADPRIRIGAAVVLIYLVSMTVLTLFAQDRANAATTAQATAEAERGHAQQQVTIAAQAQGTAESERGRAQQQVTVAAQAQMGAEASSRRSQAQALLVGSLAQRDHDPELSLLLARDAVSTTWHVGDPIVPQAEDALHEALRQSRLYTTLRGHEKNIFNAQWSPDGRFLLTTSQDWTARVWNVATGQEHMRLNGDSYLVEGASWSPKGDLIVTVGAGKGGSIVKIWDVATGQERARVQGYEQEFSRWITWSPDEQFIVTVSTYTTDDKPLVKIWNATTGQGPITIKGGEGKWSPDGQFLATMGDAHMVRIWDVTTWHELWTLPTDIRNSGDEFSWSPDGRFAGAINADNATIWDVRARKKRATLKISRSDNEGNGAYMTWSPDGRFMVTTGKDGTITVWDGITWQERAVLPDRTSQERALLSDMLPSWSQNSSYLMTAEDSIVILWNTETWQKGAILPGVNKAYWSPNGRFIAAISHDKSLKVWDVMSGQEQATLRSYPTEWVSVIWSPNSRFLATSANKDTVVQIWDITPGQEGATLHGYTGYITSATWSSDGHFLLTAGFNQIIKIWDRTTGQELMSGSGEKATWIPDSHRVAITPVNSETVHIWDAMTQQEQVTLRGHTVAVQSVSWSPDGRFLVTASVDGTAKVWDAATGQERLTLRGHEHEVVSTAWSPNSGFIVTTGEDGKAIVWDAQTGQIRATLQNNMEGVRGVSWSPDSRFLVTIGYSRGFAYTTV